MSIERLTPISDPSHQYENERGNLVKNWGHGEARALCGEERYYWDFGPCTSASGWVQYDTTQDAWYFGVWVHPEKRLVLTYAEGDLSLVECPSAKTFKAELAAMEKCYGDPPPAFRVIDADGTLTHYFDERST